WGYVTRDSSIACVEIDIRTGKLGPSQPASRPIFCNRDGTRKTDSTAGDGYTNTDYIIILHGTTYNKTIDTITIPEIQHTQPPSGYSIQLYKQPSITEGLPQFMQSSPTYEVYLTQQSNLLTPAAPSSAGHPTVQSSFQSQNPEQLNQQYNQLPTIRPSTLVQQQNQVQEPRYVNGRLIDSPRTALTRRISQELQSLWNRENSQRAYQSQFTPIDPPKLTINMTQQLFNAHRDFGAQRSYALRYIGLRTNGEHHRGFVEGLLNV
ncbi:MAG: hypothetical protein EZS28_052768, partial [Streblomastix strix]